MHRRSFLRNASLAVTAGVAATACGDDGEVDGASASGSPSADAPASSGSAADIPPPEEQTLAVQAASLEFLVGPNRYLTFGLTALDRSPLAEDRPVEVYLRTLTGEPDAQGQVVAGPLPATYSSAADTGLPIYYVQTDLEEEGLFELVAVSEGEAGAAAIQVVDPQNSRVTEPETGDPLVPGAAAVSAPTPTFEDDRGVFDVCTQEPPCGMHEVSLAEAMETGQPIVLMFATPQFCQTAVCGPSVATLDAVRADGDWGDTIFIHSEIFAEEPTGADVAATPVTDAVAAWGLPTEPWLFTIGGDGVIVDRIDGPMPAPVVRSLVENLPA